MDIPVYGRLVCEVRWQYWQLKPPSKMPSNIYSPQSWTAHPKLRLFLKRDAQDVPFWRVCGWINGWDYHGLNISPAWNAKCPIFWGNFTPKTSNYCLKNRALGFPGGQFMEVLSGCYFTHWNPTSPSINPPLPTNGPSCSTSMFFFSIPWVHPWNLTWNLKRSPCKRRFLLETIIFRFHVKFRGCNPKSKVGGESWPPRN